MADSEILRGSHSATQCREELVQITNVGIRLEHRSVVGPPVQKIEPTNVIPVRTKSGAERRRVQDGSHNSKDSGQKKTHQNIALTANNRASTDSMSTAKSRAKAMIEDATRAYGHLCDSQKAAAHIQGNRYRFKNDKKLKAARREAYKLIVQWRETLSNLENPSNGGPGPLPSSQDLVWNDTTFNHVIPTSASSDGIGKNHDSHRVQQSHVDDWGLISRAPEGFVASKAERRAFLFKKQYPDAKDVPTQHNPAAVKEMTDQYNGITFIKEVAKNKAGRKAPKQAECMTSTSGISGMSKADAIMID